MDNNNILRRIRYTFDFNDDRMIALFSEGGVEVTRAEISAWLKRDDDPAFEAISDEGLATFLNGLIIDRRGRRDGPQPVAERVLNNNLTLRKLKIALNLRDDGILELMALAGATVGRSELSAFFRKPEHRHYRECQDQFLRLFLKGMQLKFRGPDVAS